MIFPIPADARHVHPAFYEFAGEKLWAKRWRHLGEDFKRSAMLEKIGADYHWLELLLQDQANTVAADGRLTAPLIVGRFRGSEFHRHGDEGS